MVEANWISKIFSAKDHGKWTKDLFLTPFEKSLKKVTCKNGGGAKLFYH
jgi:hypothetical protein